MEESKRTCDVCGKVLVTVELLQRHKQNVHADTYDHKCDVCQKTFATLQRMRQHAQSHTGELDCPLCDKTFRWKHSLDEHIRAHKGIRPYKCDQCDADFVDNRSLKRHALKIHGMKIQGGIDEVYNRSRTKSNPGTAQKPRTKIS